MSRSARLGELSSEELLEQGRREVEAGRYIEAMQILKDCVTRQPEPPGCRELLADAFRGRVDGLANKGMFKEALALLGPMAHRCGVSVPLARHFTLLLGAGRQAQAIDLYFSAPPEDPGERQAMEVLVAALALCIGEGIVDRLPADASLTAQIRIATQALRRFCEGAMEEVRAGLKEIPFRSPLRDFRLLLNALLLFETDPGKCREGLEKLPVDSLYRSLADLYLASMLSGHELLVRQREDVNFLSPDKAAVGNISLDQIKLLRGLADEGGKQGNIPALLGKHHRCLPAAAWKAMLPRLAPHDMKTLGQLYKRQAKDNLELARVGALGAELLRDYDEALDAWDYYLLRMPRDTEDYELRQALVFRRQADLLGHVDQLFSDVDELRLEKLKKSLKFDSGDRDAWLAAIKLAQKCLSAKERDRLIQEAHQAMPEDVDILIRNIEATVDRGSFKKAARLAGRLLEIDPINTRGQQLLFSGHLQHGRKLASQGKYELAAREFTAVPSDLRLGRHRGRAAICHGMLLLKQNQAGEGEERLRQGRIEAVSPFHAALLCAVEARSFSLRAVDIKVFDRELRTTSKALKDSRRPLLDVAEWLSNAKEQERDALVEVLCCIKTWFNQANLIVWSLEEGRILCDALLTAGFFPQLSRLAAALDERFKVPLFTFMRILGVTKNGEITMNSNQIMLLTQASAKAGAAHDYLLGERIDEFLYRQIRLRLKGFPSFPFDFDLDDEDDDEFDDDNPFNLPKPKARGREARQEPKPPKAKGSQLNLFDIFDDDEDTF